MTRAATTWTIYAAVLACALFAMLFFTAKMLEFEAAVARAEARAALEENIRLALWRLDSSAAVLLAQKSEPKSYSSYGKNAAASNSFNNGYGGQQLNQRANQDVQQQLSQGEYQQRKIIVDNNISAPKDWRKLEPELIERIADILPGARLEPLPEGVQNTDDTRRLASIPARLVIPQNALQTPDLPWNTPLRISLMLAWVFAFIAALAVATLMRGALALSERRGAFVSAVTHELRTPLTTFKMYAEMLATGMVADPTSRQQYLDTLVSESDRLGHLIENVLAYARLERQLSPSRAQQIPLTELFERTLPALHRRAQQANLELVVHTPTDTTATCRTDAIAFQQILLNLVDNACKYGQSTITLTATVPDHSLEVRVADAGPGLDAKQAARIFSAFSKSKTDTAPGIGLGLFLSRRLARDLGGDLRLAPTSTGATFILTLPLG